MTPARRNRIAVAVFAVLGAVGAFVAATWAGETKPPKDVVHWRRTYGEALLEARIRNVPVFLTRHKDH
jgi:hypothetical protein